MIEFKDKKTLIVGAIIAAFTLGYFISKFAGFPESITNISIAVLIWAVFSAYLIFRGKADETGINSERRLGIGLAVVPVVLTGVGFFLMAFFVFDYVINTYIISALLLITLILIIAGMAYAVKKRLRTGLIPLLMLTIIILKLFLMMGAYSLEKEIRGQQEACYLSDDSLHCSDTAVYEDRMEIWLRNYYPRDIYIRSITAYSEAFNSDGKGGNHACQWVKTGPADKHFLLVNGTSRIFNLTNSTGVVSPGTTPTTEDGCPSRESGIINKNRYRIKVRYSWADNETEIREVNGEIATARYLRNKY